MVDAETNTTNTEPPLLTCSVCKQQVSSAWALMQHIQVTLHLRWSTMEHFKIFPRQLQHGLSLTSDHKLRGQSGQSGQDLFLHQKENLVKMPGLSSLPGPGVMVPPHFQGAQFPGPGFHFRGFPGNFGPGRLPPMR